MKYHIVYCMLFCLGIEQAAYSAAPFPPAVPAPKVPSTRPSPKGTPSSGESVIVPAATHTARTNTASRADLDRLDIGTEESESKTPTPKNPQKRLSMSLSAALDDHMARNPQVRIPRQRRSDSLDKRRSESLDIFSPAQMRSTSSNPAVTTPEDNPPLRRIPSKPVSPTNGDQLGKSSLQQSIIQAQQQPSIAQARRATRFVDEQSLPQPSLPSNLTTFTFPTSQESRDSNYIDQAVRNDDSNQPSREVEATSHSRQTDAALYPESHHNIAFVITIADLKAAAWWLNGVVIGGTMTAFLLSRNNAGQDRHTRFFTGLEADAAVGVGKMGISAMGAIAGAVGAAGTLVIIKGFADRFSAMIHGGCKAQKDMAVLKKETEHAACLRDIQDKNSSQITALFTTLRSDLGTEIAALRSDLGADNETLRKDFNTDLDNFANDIDAGFQQQRKSVFTCLGIAATDIQAVDNNSIKIDTQLQKQIPTWQSIFPQGAQDNGHHVADQLQEAVNAGLSQQIQLHATEHHTLSSQSLVNNPNVKIKPKGCWPCRR